MPTLLLEFADVAATEPSTSGGKGVSLARLTQGGFPVPTGVIVPASAYLEFLASVKGFAARVASLTVDDPTALHEQCSQLRSLLRASPLPDALDRALRERLPALLSVAPVSVRSSATLEDLAGAAFAGQHDTYLNVSGVDGVIDAVRNCFASLWEDRAVRYRREKGFAADAAAMAVVIQRMVSSDVAGVAFSVHPVTGATQHVLVNSAFGLGETVVSGEGAIDQFVLDKGTGAVVEQVIAEKEHAIVGTASGTARVNVDAARRKEPSLDTGQLRALATLARRVERFYGFPQDIEWAVADGELHLLQSRPITEFPSRWTRDESAERFPNPLTPLTWDFVSEGFHESLTFSLRLLRLPPFKGSWFKLFDGYVYGDQVAVQLFTAGYAAAFDDLDELRAIRARLVEAYRWVQELPAIWARDLDRYLLGLGRLAAVDTTRLSDAAVWEHMQSINALGSEYFRPNIAISIVQGLLHRTLYRLVALVDGPRAAERYDALTAFTELKTNLVNRDLHRLADMIRADAALGALLRSTDRRQVWEKRLLDAHPAFASAFTRFLEDHGHREVDFDTYTPTWSGQPWIVLENLRLLADSPASHDAGQRENSLRARQSAAESAFLAALPADLRDFAAELVRLARTYTALDDLEHYQTTRLNPLARATLLELGRRLVARKAIAAAEDVFFLRKQTLERLMAGERIEQEARKESAGNRSAYETQMKTPPPRVWGEAPAVIASGALRGLAGSPGTAEGPVCRVLSVDDFARFVPGSVLVARTTNPAWTPLFYSAAAVVTESGGPLSHGAVTAREVGIPAVMAVHGALTAFADGERVSVNGTQGTVTRT